MRILYVLWMLFASTYGGKKTNKPTYKPTYAPSYKPTYKPTYAPIYNTTVPPTPPPVADVVCRLQIPDNPLTAEGLATPYELIGCDMGNVPSFVQATILDLDTGILSVYSPLVINQGTLPGIPPVVPLLPNNNAIGIWFGSNGDVLILTGAVGIANGNCVNGLPNDPFGQFAYCNAVEFFNAVYNGGVNITLPPLGVASDGGLCPTTRDFFIVDADPNDNLQTTYLLSNGQTSQDTIANRNTLGNFKVLVNPSDERLLTHEFNPAMGCDSFLGEDLADPGVMVASLGINEIHSVLQSQPVALLPSANPMTLVNGKANLEKLNLYRSGVNQPLVMNIDTDASTPKFCHYMLCTGLTRLVLNQAIFEARVSPAPDVANNAYNFLITRFSNSYDVLGCPALLNIPNPITTVVDNVGVVTGVTVATY